jgi:hypothetical protein
MWLRARRARPPKTLCRSRADSTLQPTEMGAPPENTGGALCFSALRADRLTSDGAPVEERHHELGSLLFGPSRVARLPMLEHKDDVADALRWLARRCSAETTSVTTG